MAGNKRCGYSLSRSPSWHGLAGGLWRVWVRQCAARSAWQARFGRDWVARRVLLRSGQARSGAAPQASLGSVRTAGHGGVRHGRRVMASEGGASPGSVCHRVARQARPGRAVSVTSWRGESC
jgi:hypothetical protein